MPAAPMQVLVAGGGVAGLEACLALRDLAGELVECTLLTPEEEFVYRPMAVAEPFARGRAERQRLDAIASDIGVRLLRGALAEVDDRTRTAVTADGERALLRRAARRRRRRHRARDPTRDDLDAGSRRRGLRRAAAGHRGGLQQAGRVRRPDRRGLAAARLRARADDRLAGREHGPRRPRDHDLHARGRAAGGFRQRRHARAARGPRGGRHRGRAVRARARVGREAGRRARRAGPAGRHPRRRAAARGRAQPSRADQRHARLHPLRPARQGLRHRHRLGRRRRDRVPDQAGRARLPAGRSPPPRRSPPARAPTSSPQPFRPVLRGVLLTGRGKAWMRKAPDSEEGETERRALFWPPTKIAGRYLSPYLLERAEARSSATIGGPAASRSSWTSSRPCPPPPTRCAPRGPSSPPKSRAGPDGCGRGRTRRRCRHPK